MDEDEEEGEEGEEEKAQQRKMRVCGPIAAATHTSNQWGRRATCLARHCGPNLVLCLERPAPPPQKGPCSPVQRVFFILGLAAQAEITEKGRDGG